MLCALALAGLVGPADASWRPGRAEAVQAQAAAVATVAAVQPPPAIVEPPPVETVLRSGVLIVVSKATQQMYVFKDGRPWRTTPESTGRRGHSTPSGTFAILQKRVFHRSNIYSGAPMPYMQRLTWGGIAIHAGRLPGYPASHGCIRVPREFARALFDLTRAGSTTVIVANEPIRSDRDAHAFALGLPPRQPVSQPALAAAPVIQAEPVIAAASAAPALVRPAIVARNVQTIQLAAATSPGEAEAHWQQLLGARPDLAGFSVSVIPAVVGTRRFYRLRASAPGAHAYCSSLKSQGIDCFNVS